MQPPEPLDELGEPVEACGLRVRAESRAGITTVEPWRVAWPHTELIEELHAIEYAAKAVSRRVFIDAVAALRGVVVEPAAALAAEPARLDVLAQ